jgi:hypothetical protein
MAFEIVASGLSADEARDAETRLIHLIGPERLENRQVPRWPRARRAPRPVTCFPAPLQMKAARYFVNWTQPQLAEKANIALRTLMEFECGRRTPIRGNLTAMVSALKEGGVEFTADGGVRPRARP